MQFYHASVATIRRMRDQWQAVIRRKGHPTLSKCFPKKSLAERWARQEEERLALDRVTPVAQRMTVAKLLEWYGQEFTHRKRSGSRETSRITILSDRLGDKALTALTAQAVVAYVDKRQDEGMKADTIRKELGTLSVAIDAGIALKGIDLPANPVKTAKGVLSVTKTLTPGTRRDRRPTGEELAELYKSNIGDLIEFAAETAMRRGELAAMRWGDVRGTVLSIPKTKTDKARTIPLSARAQAILEARKPKDAKDEALVWGRDGYSITRAFGWACKRFKIDGLRFHDLRHEGTSRLFERGLDLMEVASVTGHEDLDSLKRYTHLCPKRLAKKLA